MISRYSCNFANEAGDGHVIVVDLSAHEIDRARAHVCPEVAAKAYALRAAYARVPTGFRHYDVTPVWVN
jgi:hypothetical protein